MKNVLFISYLSSDYSRSGSLLSALRNDGNYGIDHFQIEGVNAKGIAKLWNFLRMHKHDYNVVVIMSPAHLLAIVVRQFYHGFVILDAGWPLSDSSSIRRGKHSLRFFMDLLIDRISMALSDLVILESRIQASSLMKRKFKFRRVPQVIYTGVREDRFSKKTNRSLLSRYQESPEKIKVVFRGKFNDEAGLEFIQRIFAERSHIFELLVCCPDLPENFVKNSSISFITHILSDIEISEILSRSHLAVSQFGDSERIGRSIAHKIFEYAYFGIPTICTMNSATKEVFSINEFFYIDKTQLGSFLDNLDSNREVTMQELYNRSERILIRFEQSLSEQAMANHFYKIISNLE